MKRIASIFFALSAMIVGVSSAIAADVPRPYVYQAPIPAQLFEQPTFDWTGFYAGFKIDHNWGEFDFNNIDPKTKGWSASIGGGYNIRLNDVVLSIEANVGKTNAKGQNDFSYTDCCGDTFKVKTRTGYNTYGDVLGRGGILLGNDRRVLLYGLAGLGWATGWATMENIGSYGNASWLADSASAKVFTYGPKFGIGAEVMLTPKISLDVRATHTIFTTTNISGASSLYGGTVMAGIKPTTEVKAGLTIHFN